MTSAGDSRSGPSARAQLTIPAAVALNVLGSADENLLAIESELAADVHVRSNQVTLTGEQSEVIFAERVFAELQALAGRGQAIGPDVVRRTVGMLSAGGAEAPSDVLSMNILSRRGRTIRPKTLNQKRYVDAIDSHTVVFGIGPAGTGKTYLAMAKAVQALQNKNVNRIILTRPAVEAGERLGFLPGTLSEKIDPYLRPLYDALHDMVDPDSIQGLIDAGTIEIAPLAYMRGRAQPVFAKVLTPTGWCPIGALQIGDLVIGSDGKPTPVLGVYPQGEKDIYRVSTQDGASTLATGDHLWSVYTASDRRRNKPARVLKTTDMIGNLRAAHARRYELPMVNRPVEFEPQPVPMEPYALGLLLGDGCMTGKTTPSFATADPELAAELQRNIDGITVRHKAGVDYVLNRVRSAGDVVTLENPVTHALRELGLWGTRSDTKFVPAEYLYNASYVRWGVLLGLFDSDGGPVTQAGRTCRVQYTTASSQLADDVVFLVQSLGGVAYRRVRSAAGRAPGSARGRAVHHRHDAHILDIRLPTWLPPFRLGRKLEKWDCSHAGRPMRFIDSIEPAGTAPAVCIQVAAADSLYITDDFLLTHNTLNDAFIILDEAQNTTPEQMKMFLTRLGFGSKVVVTGDVTQVDLPGGQKSGLRVVRDILSEVDDVNFSTLTSIDVVRHRLVGDIVDAYEKWQAYQQT